MTMRLKLAPALCGAVVLSPIMTVAPADAQSSQHRGASAQAAILGPMKLRPGAADLRCGAGPAGLESRSADLIERTLSLDDSQRAIFNALKTASQRAIQYLNESCPKIDATSPTGRLEIAERRLSAMLEAVRTVQPALDDFYAALTDEQKARLAATEPSGDTAVAPAPAAPTHQDRRPRHRRRAGHLRLPFRLPL